MVEDINGELMMGKKYFFKNHFEKFQIKLSNFETHRKDFSNSETHIKKKRL